MTKIVYLAVMNLHAMLAFPRFATKIPVCVKVLLDGRSVVFAASIFTENAAMRCRRSRTAGSNHCLSAISKSIRNLEQSLVRQRLVRHPTGVTPTEYGLVLVAYATLVTSELDRAVKELNALRGRGRSVVQVGAESTMMRFVLAQAVRRFMKPAEGNSVSFRQRLKIRASC